MKSAPVAAQEQGADEDLLGELMEVVDESTDIATKSHMNSDFVPGMVTILHGDELEALGARTVFDAISLIPGVLASRGSGAAPSMLVRGISYPFNSGNVKILVNSVSMSRESAGVNNSIAYLPIEQVERIEFIRGPGSLLYGGYASMGVLNIVTRTSGRGFFTRLQSDGGITGGGNFTYQAPEHDFNFSLNVAGFDTGNAEAPVNVDAREDRKSAILTLDFHGFGIKAQRVDRDYDVRGQAPVSESNQVLDLSKHLSLGPDLDATVSFSGSKNEFDNGITHFDGDLWEWHSEVNWRFNRMNELVARFIYSDGQIDRASQLPPPGVPQTPALTDIRRTAYSFGIQDQFNFNDHLSLTAGVRYDKRNDLGVDRLTPRVSVVWRATDQHILKAQYAEGFRAPTFFELYPASGKAVLDLEVVRTAELSYIYRRPDSVGRVTGFYTRLSNMIFPDPPTFRNKPKGRAQGVELEWDQQLTSRLKWKANVSYVDSWDTRTPTQMRSDDSSSADWLANVAVTFKLLDKLLLSGRWNYVGPRNADAPRISSEHRLVLTLSAFDVLTKGLTLRAGIQNVAEDVEHAVSELPTGLVVEEYPDRHAWLQASYDW